MSKPIRVLHIFGGWTPEEQKVELWIFTEILIGTKSNLISLFTLLIKGFLPKINPASKLLLVGDGALRPKIVKKINELKIGKHVILTGVRDDVSDHLQVADALIFPSLFEGLPGVVLESQAAGLPCVISKNITKEVKITDLVKYLPLDMDARYWAKQTLESINKTSLRQTFNEIKNAGYDIRSVSEWYEHFYLSNTDQEIEGLTI